MFNIGDIVAYHGTLGEYHGLARVDYVDGDRLLLRGWGTRKDVVLRGVRPFSVTLVKAGATSVRLAALDALMARRFQADAQRAASRRLAALTV